MTSTIPLHSRDPARAPSVPPPARGSRSLIEHERCAHHRYYEDGPDGAADPNVAIHSNFLPTYLPAATMTEETEPVGPRHMNIEELQKLLGQVETDEQGEALFESPRYIATSDANFEEKRQVTALCERHAAAAPPATSRLPRTAPARLRRCMRTRTRLMPTSLDHLSCARRVIGDLCRRGTGCGGVCRLA